MKKITLRKCLATNTMLPKEDLLRVVKSKEGNIFVDLTSKANGRGAYISKTMDALTLAKKKKVFERAFECEVPESLYIEIEEIIKKGV